MNGGLSYGFPHKQPPGSKQKTGSQVHTKIPIEFITSTPPTHFKAWATINEKKKKTLRSHERKRPMDVPCEILASGRGRRKDK
jgi:hypothetical protein